MVRLREIPRTAAFAWSPGASNPLIATGTKAGAISADFSNETALELWDLGLDNAHSNSDLQPVGTISAESRSVKPLKPVRRLKLINDVNGNRFYDIAWGKPSVDRPLGILAGGLENGALGLWDAEKLRVGPAR
jgi:protein transport protein SEC31